MFMAKFPHKPYKIMIKTMQQLWDYALFLLVARQRTTDIQMLATFTERPGKEKGTVEIVKKCNHRTRPLATRHLGQERFYLIERCCFYHPS